MSSTQGWALLALIVILAGAFLRELTLRREAEAGRAINKETADKALARVSSMAQHLAETDAARVDSEAALATLREQQERGRQRDLDAAGRTALSKAPRCTHCGGVHSVACPRVKRMRFRPDGQSIYEIEFWADAEWSRDYVIFPEDYPVEDKAVPEGA